MRVIGLMSGTSLDGIDAALIETDGLSVQAMGPAHTEPYPVDFRNRLRALLGGAAPDRVDAVEAELTDLHAEAVHRLLARNGLAIADIDLIGFHGHTILHQPEAGRTWQIGDGARLAQALGRPVVADFRSADVAAGGQGAPLVPLFHAALAAGLQGPLVVLNLGGVANVTWIGADGTLLAFDTGPGMALLDDWVLTRTGQAFDDGGALAARGRIDADLPARLLAEPYFSRPAPKSLDRDQFAALLAGLSVAHLSVEDGAASLMAMTIAGVVAAQAQFPQSPQRWLVAGGGRHHGTLMAGLAAALPVPVDPVEQVGWQGDALEAQAFAFLAARSLAGLPISLPGTTGVSQPMHGGRLHAAPRI